MKPEIKLTRTGSANSDFISLVKELDAYHAVKDGKDHAWYSQFNKVDSIKHVVIVYENDVPVACGAIKKFSDDAMEIKRMYTRPQSRGKGIATSVLNELESWAAELSCTKCVLETGKRQPEAIKLYKKNGYKIIPNYGQYAAMENSVCFEKEIKK